MSDISNLFQLRSARAPLAPSRRRVSPGLHRAVYAYDLLACAAAILLAQILVSGLPQDWTGTVLLTGAAAAIGAVALPAVGVYSASLRYASLDDLMRLTIAGTFVVVALVLAAAVLPLPNPGPSAFIVTYLALMPLLILPRLYHRRDDFAVRKSLRRGAQGPGEGDEAALLVGNGTACELFLRSLRQQDDPKFFPVGILEDASDSFGTCIHNTPILGSYRDGDAVREMLHSRGIEIDRIILTEPMTRLGTESLSPLLAWARFEGIAVSELPPLTALQPLESEKDLGMTDLNVAELLERQEARVDYDLIRRMVSGRRVLVTGAGGSIGSELTRQIAALGPSEIVLVENCELNNYEIDMDLQRHFPHVVRQSYICCVRDADRLREIFYRHRPELIFNAAALKHVPIVELNPCEGVLTNVIGARNLADIALETGAMAMIQVSTDKAVNTSNVMGATKRVAEFYCQALDRRGGTRFMTVRFGNVLGSSGSLIPLFQRQIAQGGPLTVTDPRMERFFMTIREAVELTLLASASGLERALGQGQIMVLDMGEPIRIIDIAKRMIRLAGLKPGVDIEIKTIGIRPGEKLFEELFDAAETRQDSGIEGIHTATPEGVPLEQMKKSLLVLERAARRGQTHLVISTLADIVPGYDPMGLIEAAEADPDPLDKGPSRNLTIARAREAHSRILGAV